VRELQAAPLGVACGGDDPRLRSGGIGGLEIGLRDDDAIDDLRFLLIVALAVREVVFLRHRARRLEDGVVDLAALLGEARTRGQRLDVEELVEEELEIARMQELAHGEYAMQSISTRSPSPGSPAAWMVVRAGRWSPNTR